MLRRGGGGGAVVGDRVVCVDEVEPSILPASRTAGDEEDSRISSATITNTRTMPR